MKIQCNACELAEAIVMCCADEAALCAACDQKVHAANKLAGKHQRVPLIRTDNDGSQRVPKCDVCQEASGYFFCLEDRALLCRNCDVSIHTSNSYVSAHRRFLLTGVQVGLESSEPITPSDKDQSSTTTRVTESTGKMLPKGNPNISVSLSEEAKEAFPSQVGTNGDIVTNKESFTGCSVFGSLPDWPLNEFFGFPDLNHSFGFTDYYTSKADSSKLGSSEGSPPNYCLGEGLDVDECLGQVPEVPWMVPDIPLTPTASGLHWQKNLQYPVDENTISVPDIKSSHDTQFRARSTITKRRRLLYEC